MEKLLIDLFDFTGNSALPYLEAGWRVIQIDKKHGSDIMDFEYQKIIHEDRYKFALPQVGIIAMIPCTAYALSGNRHKKSEKRVPIFNESQKLVARTKEIIDYFDRLGILQFWMIEQPRTDIHTINPWIGKIRQRIHPHLLAGYDPIPENSQYRKWTWLFGNFNLIPEKPLPPLQHEFPGFTNLGGGSERTKELRSATPLGLSYGFHHANP